MIRRLNDAMLIETVPRRLTTEGRLTDKAEAAADEAEAFRAGYRDGFEAGEADGLREAMQRASVVEDELRHRLEAEELALATERERLKALIEGLAATQRDNALQMERAAFEIALHSMMLAFGAMEEDRELLRRLIGKLAGDFRADVLSVQVARDDRDFLPQEIDGLEILVRDGLTAGSCVLTTARGQIETSIADRLSAIHQSMLEAADRSRP